MQKILKKIYLQIKILWHSLFYGMKNADTKMLSSTNDALSGGIYLSDVKHSSNVYEALLNGEMTKEVEALRDHMYTVERESANYMVTIRDGELQTTKKTPQERLKEFNKSSIYTNENDGELILVQDIKRFSLELFDVLMTWGRKDEKTYMSPLQVERVDENNPLNIKIEDFADKICIFQKDDKYTIHVYFEKEPTRFCKADHIMYRHFLNKLKYLSQCGEEFDYRLRNTSIDIKSLKFLTYAALGDYDYKTYSLDDLKCDSIVNQMGKYIVVYKTRKVDVIDEIAENIRNYKKNMVV